MISKTGEAETITSHYLFALGSYRGLYILNWIYRFYYENSFDIIAVVAGIVQTVLYMDFFYLYITKGSFQPVFMKYLMVKRNDAGCDTTETCKKIEPLKNCHLNCFYSHYCLEWVGTSMDALSPKSL